jgi:hypothetical protein
LIESRNEARTILDAVAKAPSSPAWQHLSWEERAEIAHFEKELGELVEGDDLDALRRGTEALDKATRRFAELMMDVAVTSALHGQTMDSAGDKLGEGPTAPHPFAPAEYK